MSGFLWDCVVRERHPHGIAWTRLVCLLFPIYDKTTVCLRPRAVAFSDSAYNLKHISSPRLVTPGILLVLVPSTRHAFLIAQPLA